MVVFSVPKHQATNMYKECALVNCRTRGWMGRGACT